jgi:hypothetical protein
MKADEGGRFLTGLTGLGRHGVLTELTGLTEFFRGKFLDRINKIYRIG